jgi:hypothetical protein
MSVSIIAARRNHLLNQLSDAELQPLLTQLQIVEHACKDIVCHDGRVLEAVYFPCTSIFSSVVCLEDDTAIEVGAVGNEGFTSIELLLGAARATETILCRAAGGSLRMDVPGFRAAIATQNRLRSILQRASQAYLFLVLQGGACQHWHGAEGRFARLLLETQDRIGQDRFSVAHEATTCILGIDRLALNEMTGAFQLAGMIQYSQETLSILNRQRLEETACECYARIRNNTQRLDVAPLA